MHGLFLAFTIDYLEERFGLDVLDEVIGSLDLVTEGAYTAVSSYPTQELLSIVFGVADRVAISREILMQDVGEALIPALRQRHPGAFEEVHNTLDFVSKVHEHIHLAVRQRYPGTRPPDLLVSRRGKVGHIVYRSSRPLADLAIGMLRGCIAMFGGNERVEILATDERGFSAELYLHGTGARARSA
ncbi:MAG: heme NO-binding domain-containing protein [Gammaproteobacteria bacterium]|nr:heme NO-binding domain-containing protein [Gammaproteobacteria bacterium]